MGFQSVFIRVSGGKKQFLHGDGAYQIGKFHNRAFYSFHYLLKRPLMQAGFVSISPEPKAKQAERPTKIAEQRANLSEQRGNITEQRGNITEQRTNLTERQVNMTERQTKWAEQHPILIERCANLTALTPNLIEHRSDQ